MVGGGLLFASRPSGAAENDSTKFFIAEAFRMKSEAVAAGDQPYGAVLVKDGAIVGYGPSRAVAERDDNAHAERVALRDARRRLGIEQISGTVLYSTSRPCVACERAAAAAGVALMIYGAAGTDGGRPRSGGVW